MNIDRKTFIRGLGLGAVGAMVGPGAGCASPTASATHRLPVYSAATDGPFWRAVRAQYPIDPEFHYMNTGGLGAAANPVLKVFHDTTMELQVKPATGHDYFHGARLVVAKFFAAEESEVCFTRNATEGNSIIAGGLDLAAGDEVIFENHAHPGGSGPWYNQHNRRGVVVKLFEPDPTSVEGNLARIQALITPRTKVIQISHVTAPTGIVLPAAEIGRLAHGHGIWFHIDGAQSAGMFPFKFRDLGCDSYATSGHKWLGAPHETGLLLIRKERNDEVVPISAGSYTGMLPSELTEAFGREQMAYLDNATRHEYATRSAANVLGIAAALDFQDAVGRERIALHSRTLSVHLHEGLAKIPTVEVLTPTRPELRASITTFRTPRISYSDLFDLLLFRHQFRCRPVSEQNLDALRISTHLFNSADEVEGLIAAISNLVRHA